MRAIPHSFPRADTCCAGTTVAIEQPAVKEDFFRAGRWSLHRMARPLARALDMRALKSWPDQAFGERELIADMPRPPGTPPRSLVPVLERGRLEPAMMAERLTPMRSRAFR
jgi:hypothetical protein